MKIAGSIRWRLTAWLAFLLTAILVGFGFTAYRLQKAQVMTGVNEQLAKRVAAISRDARGPNGPGMPPPEFGPGGFRPEDSGRGESGSRGFARENFRPGGFDGPPPARGPRDRSLRLSEATRELLESSPRSYHAVWGMNGTLRGSDGSDLPPVPGGSRGDTRMKFRSRGELREAWHFTEMGECVLAGRSIAPELSKLRRFRGKLTIYGLGILAFGLGGLWWLISRALLPVKEISRTAERIAGGDLAERIDAVDPRGELGQLAAVLNSTFDRLEAAFARQTQFTSDASHELRTPLSVMISEAQTALARERSGAEYREALQECLEAGRRMSGLTSALLELARIDGGSDEPQRFDLAELAAGTLEALQPKLDERGIRSEALLEPAEILADPVGAGIVVSNLVVNAAHYNRPDGTIRVTTGRENGFVMLRVEDTGIGIREEDLPHVFDRFYRADKVRSRAEGRHGLGLAICREIANRQGATIEVSSEWGIGSTFTVRWPDPS